MVKLAKFKVLIGSRSFGKADRTPIDRLVAAGCEVIPNDVGRAYTEDELIERIGDIDAIITGADAITRAVIESARRLKVISKHGIGTENIDIEAAYEHGVTVTATPGVMDDSVADHALALLLALLRHLIPSHVETASGAWNPRFGTELRGKTAGIVGLGRIGRKVAERLQAFGVRVIAFDPSPDEAYARERNIEFVTFEGLLESADIICLHAPGTGELLDARALERVKPGAVLINTSRGVLVDEHALAESLQNGRLAGAGLDVFRKEPPLDSPLLGLDNVIVTPHVAGLTTEALIRMGAMAAENVLRALRGEEPLYRVR